MNCCMGGLQVMDKWLGCDLHLKENCLGKFYKNHPVMSRVTMVPLATLSGFAKVFLFPVICAVGIVAFPIIAAVRACQGKGDSLKYLSAWAFSVLGVAATFGFMTLTAYHMPLLWSSALFVGICAISITIHVYKACKEPHPTSSQNLTPARFYGSAKKAHPVLAV